jgi:hypothetical protein
MIEVSELRKRFGPVLALDVMSFTPGPGRSPGSSARMARANCKRSPITS